MRARWKEKMRTIKLISNGFLDYRYGPISHFDFNEILSMDVDSCIFYGDCRVLTLLVWLAYKSFSFQTRFIIEFHKKCAH